MARDTIRGSIRSFFGNVLGGVRGPQNIAAWLVAGTAAYYLWIKPERDALREAEARLLAAREKDLQRYVDRVKPVSDLQNRGRKLIKGKPKEPAQDQ